MWNNQGSGLVFARDGGQDPGALPVPAHGPGAARRRAVVRRALRMGQASGETKEGVLQHLKTVWGEKHTILAPVVKFENDQISPKWQTGPVTHCAATREEWM